jgi:16S rRNA (guanine527-N7)-methyltransferase
MPSVPFRAVRGGYLAPLAAARADRNRSAPSSSVVTAARVPAPPEVARDVFGPRLELAMRYGQRLATDGVLRGLIGPREVPRLWERHLVNCAVITDLVPQAARVVDVGSGAGLPGLAMACRRPDLRVDLVESLTRRAAFLAETVSALGLEATVRVVHGRAEDAAVRVAVGGVEWVTARAVAPLDRLVRWCVPLLRPGGTLLAMKGRQAAAELAALRRSGGTRSSGFTVSIVQCGAGRSETPATVVAVQRDRHGGEGGD